MSLSTNSVIHYTDSLSNLKGILREGFHIKYCVERFISKITPISGAFAMVSFCDIPLSETKNHITSYGGYGIGLSKQWATENGMNPVLYIDKNSLIGEIVIDQVKRLIADKTNSNKVFKEDSLYLLSYIKNYQSQLIRKGKIIDKNYNFYNEREWRFTPNKKQFDSLNKWLSAKVYNENRELHNDKIKNIKLEFQVSDISYLIVKDEKEVIEIIKYLRDIFSDKCSATQLELLMTRIITLEHIFNDF